MGKIECCHGCAPPKRRPGCHSNCIDYILERAALDEKNDREYKKRMAAQGVYDQREKQIRKAVKDKRRLTK